MDESLKPEQLKESLNEIFSEYGEIIDIVAKKNLQAKGQAFVVFKEVESAARAIGEIQGFDLADKPMILDFAKTQSDATVQLQGSAEEFEQHRRRRLAEKGQVLKEFLCLEMLTCHRTQASSRGSGND